VIQLVFEALMRTGSNLGFVFCILGAFFVDAGWFVFWGCGRHRWSVSVECDWQSENTHLRS
jgi:hypothetical protein